MKKRILSGLLVILMLFSSVQIPVNATGLYEDFVVLETITETEETTATDTTTEEVNDESASTEEYTTEIPVVEVTTEGTTTEEYTTETPTVEEDTDEVITEEVTTEETTAEETTEGLVMEDAGLEASSSTELITEEIDGSEWVFQEGAFKILEDTSSDASGDNALEDGVFEAANKTSVAKYMYNQLKKKPSSINIAAYGIKAEDMAAIYFGMLNDHPDLYYVRSYVGYSYSPSTHIVSTVTPHYISGYDSKLFETELNDALSFAEPDMTDLEKAIAMHEYLGATCEYDRRLYSGNMPNASYTPYGVLVNKQAVCQGYALTYKLLMDKLGVECYMVISDNMDHAWNMVKIDGEYYHVDVTWDAGSLIYLDSCVGHEYLFLSDDFIKTEGDHYDWKITKGSDVITSRIKADSDKYDDAFWLYSNTPLIIEDDDIYYVKGMAMQAYLIKRNINTGAETEIAKIKNGNFTVETAYRVGNKLFYNDVEKIYSYNLENGSIREETGVLSTESAYFLVSGMRDGVIKYALQNKTTREITTYDATLLNPYEIPVNKLTLDKEQVYINPGESTTIKATILPSYAKENVITWASSDESIATVEGGVIKGIKGGSCIVTASSGGKTVKCNVSVRIKLEPPTFTPQANEEGKATIDKDGTVTLTADYGAPIYYTLNGKNPSKKKSSSNFLYTEPFKITKDVTVKAIAIAPSDAYVNSDVATIKYAACTNNLILSETEMQITEGEKKQLVIKEVPTTTTMDDVVWESTNKAAATVDQSGNVTAVYEGKTQIIATTTDHLNREVVAVCEVEVVPPLHKVTFMGHATKPIKIDYVYERKAANAPTVTPPKGYVFTEWDKEFDYITEDITVNAEYELETYSITYRCGNNLGVIGYPSTYTVETDTITIEPLGDLEDQKFVGWYSDSRYNSDPVTVIEKGTTGDIVIYAKWKDIRGLWMEDIPNQDYTRSAIKPQFTVFYGDTELQAGTDYTVKYKNNTVATASLSEENQIKKAPVIEIKGKGNYAGTLKKNFYINQKNIEDADVMITSPIVKNKKDSEIYPVPTVTWNNKKLANKKEFVLEYPDKMEGAYILPGEYTIKVHGTGNYTGTRTITMTILNTSTEVSFSDGKIKKIPDQKYAPDKAVELTKDMPEVTYKGKQLQLGTDYELLYGECKDIGTYSVIVRGIADKQGTDFIGEKTVSFKIVGTPITKMKVSKLEGRTYTGSDITFNPNAEEGTVDYIAVTDSAGNKLIPEKDYRLEYSGNRNAGTGKVKIIGMGSYSGTMTKSFKITAASLKEENKDIQVAILNGQNPCKFEKNGAKPKVKIVYQGNTLIEGTDYTLSYANNKTALPQKKSPTIIIKGKKNFKDSRKVYFSIDKKDISLVNITAPDMQENAKAGKFFSKPTLTDTSGKKLVAGKDYEKTYVYTDENGTVLDKLDTPKAGDTLTVTVTGKGSYTGTVSTTFRIFKAGNNMSKAKVTFLNEYQYNGDKIAIRKSDIKVEIGKNAIDPQNYEIVGYINNTKKGTATMLIRGKGEYGGTKKVTFKIDSMPMVWWKKE